MRDITNDLEVTGVDSRELSSLLWTFFQGPLEISKSQINFSKVGVSPILQMFFNKDHSLKSIQCASELSDDDLALIKQRIRDELLDQSLTKVGREILFSSFAVNGFFTIKNEMQILPVPANAPKQIFWGIGHPFLLEFQYVASKNGFIDSFRRVQQISRISAILAVFLEGGIEQRQSRARGHWVIIPDKEPGKQEYKNLPAGYGYDGFKAVDTNFSRTDEFSPLIEIPDQEYFFRWGLINTKPLEIPNSLGSRISKFWQLPVIKREQFCRAAYWHQQAHNLYSASKSSSYLAAVMAIETLVEDEKTPAKCPTCKKALENGPTKKFRDFLEKYARFTSDSNNEHQVRTQLYDLRCDLAHGEQIFLEDIDHGSWAMASTQSADEDNKMELIFRFTRVALVNWLEDQPI